MVLRARLNGISRAIDEYLAERRQDQNITVMAELKALLAERRQLKSSLTRFKHFLEKQNSSEQIALSELDVRLSQIQDHLKKFEDIQLKIEILSTENESSDVLEDINERDSFESNFYSAISLATDISNQCRITEQNHEHSITDNDIRTVDNKVFDNLQQVRLPQLNLPTFNGDYSEWLFFRDSFKSLIHENGEAAQVVQSLGVSANNYDTAWSLLNERYENIPLLVGNHQNRSSVTNPPQGNESHAFHSYKDSNSILLSTAIVQVTDNQGKVHECRALLDSGSESNFITEKLCNTLNLPRTLTDITINGIGQSASQIIHRVSVNMQSRLNNFKVKLPCLVIKNITNKIPQTYFDIEELQIPKKCALADPAFNMPCQIDILLGAQIFWDLVCVGQIKLGKITQHFKNSFGLVSIGHYTCSMSNISSCNFSHLSNDLNDSLKKFWEIEHCPGTQIILSNEERACEKHFAQNTKRNSDGRFIVSLPLTNSSDRIGDNRANAVKRFYNIEKRFQRDQNLFIEYKAFIDEYINLNHMTKIVDMPEPGEYFLPHHCVFKESSTTTRLRIVFDGSCKTNTGLSLNDIMMVGPTIQEDIFAILLRFRIFDIVIKADIAKMYRQVLVSESDRKLQKIFWRNKPSDQLDTYQLNTVTYGTSAAAFLAIRCLNQLAYEHKESHPEASEAILKCFYVDDLLYGGTNISDIIRVKNDINAILQKAGFELRKWVSNDERVFQQINKPKDCTLGEHENSKTLGLKWIPAEDQLSFEIGNFDEEKPVTKRTILSMTAQLFDPLGLLSPVIIIPKVMLQRLWQANLHWDESVPLELHTRWLSFRNELMELANLKIPRHVVCTRLKIVQLHGFSDSSEQAYGACVYLRTVDVDDKVFVNLLCSKSRVTPVKIISIPRLELCAAVLLAELTQRVFQALNMDIQSVHYWCDSKIVLSWISASAHKWKTFVANRVARIQELSNPNEWHYVHTSDNPADLISRGLNKKLLINTRLWWNGPSWLRLNSCDWPAYSHKIDNIPEERFNRDRKNERITGPLSVKELNFALKRIVLLVQLQEFSQEIDDLKRSGRVNVKSKLFSLNPFLDDGIIRVGGRIKHSNFNLEKKHPAVLPSKHNFTILLMNYEHFRLLHAPPNLLLASIREKFWPLSGRSLAKRIVHDCMKCFRFNPTQSKYLMGDLPSTRLMPTRPFLIAGCDYAGPFLLRDRSTRNFKLTKCYICLFICFSTKAVHLELVSSLSTEIFLSALRRFFARRGKSQIIYSDHGTNFQGAKSELYKFLMNKTVENDIKTKLSNESVMWSFIPPRAPHFGGLWESNIKSVKSHLKRIIGEQSLTYEQFSTVLCQVEACLNSRPLSPLSSDPNDLLPITPAHFLIGETLMSQPEPDLTNVKENLLSKLQQCQQMVQHFWNRWSKEYISELQIRSKWKQSFPNVIKPGILVIVKEDNTPPLKWQLGRVVGVHPGADNVIRAVSIKTSRGTIQRPVMKTCVLPEHCQAEKVEA
ncbi:uncharacterized protein LOC115884169 [Sitophilus oryzae]|uniref:Uncharacterized protein LOC115884169 n=1 Tax=Sitophilus oryzae TaxID=7048 RepID=A0A6J2Y6D2_SITOR|nr:uncharacterized protein LOC115884169 [Sitophilus oryzae]